MPQNGYKHKLAALLSADIDDIKEAQQMFEKTMRLEPDSSFGYAPAAWAHWWSVNQGLTSMLQKAGLH